MMIKKLQTERQKVQEDRLSHFWGYETGMGQKVTQFRNRRDDDDNDDDDDDDDDISVK